MSLQACQFCASMSDIKRVHIINIRVSVSEHLISSHTYFVSNCVCYVLVVYAPVNNFSGMPRQFPVFSGENQYQETNIVPLLKDITQGVSES